MTLHWVITLGSTAPVAPLVVPLAIKQHETCRGTYPGIHGIARRCWALSCEASFFHTVLSSPPTAIDGSDQKLWIGRTAQASKPVVCPSHPAMRMSGKWRDSAPGSCLLMQQVATIMREFLGKLCPNCWDSFHCVCNCLERGSQHALFLWPLWPKQWHFHCLAEQE